MMAFFMAPPSIGGIIQTFVYGVAWILGVRRRFHYADVYL
jgi:hypothetical protein